MPTTPRGFGNKTGARTSIIRLPASQRMTRFHPILRGGSVVVIPRQEPSPTVRLPRDPQQTGHIP